jgi:hypothetical protein
MQAVAAEITGYSKIPMHGDSSSDDFAHMS